MDEESSQGPSINHVRTPQMGSSESYGCPGRCVFESVIFFFLNQQFFSLMKTCFNFQITFSKKLQKNYTYCNRFCNPNPDFRFFFPANWFCYFEFCKPATRFVIINNLKNLRIIFRIYHQRIGYAILKFAKFDYEFVISDPNEPFLANFHRNLAESCHSNIENND